MVMKEESLFNYSVTDSSYAKQNNELFLSQYYVPPSDYEIKNAVARGKCEPLLYSIDAINCSQFISGKPFYDSCMNDFFASMYGNPFYISSFVDYAELCTLYLRHNFGILTSYSLLQIINFIKI